MTAIGSLFSSPLAQAIGWALVHLLWQGVLVAAILAASLALLRKQSANARYLAACGSLILIVALSVITAYRAYDPLRGGTAPGLEARWSDAAVGAVPLSQIPETDEPVVKVDRVAAMGAYAGAHLAQIVLVWLVGVTLLSVRLAIGWVGAHRLAARNAQLASEQWQRAMKRIADALQLRRTIRLLESAAVEVPTVIGWLRPVVLLPVSTLSGMPAEQIEMILAHELAHIRRHDFIVNLVQSTVETLFFYQPAVWWISHRIRIEREHCCDDAAVAVFGDAIRYARALTRFEELRIESAQTVLAANGGSLLGRIRRLVGRDGEAANWSSRWTAGAALLAVLATLLVTPALPMFARHEQAPVAAPAATTVEVTPAPDDHPTAQCDKNKAEHEEQADDSEDDNESIDIETPEAAPVPEPAPMVRAVVAAHAAPIAIPVVAPMVAGATAMIAPAARMAADAAIAATIGVDDEEEIEKEIDKERPDGKLSVDELIELRNAGVTPEYINEMRSLFGEKIRMRDIATLRIHGVTTEYVREMRAIFGNTVTARDIASLRVQGVTSDEVRNARSMFGESTSLRDIISLKAVGVTPTWLREMKAAGVDIKSARDASSLRAMGVTPAFVKALADAGYTNLSARDLSRLAGSGVTIDFIREMQKYKANK